MYLSIAPFYYVFLSFHAKKNKEKKKKKGVKDWA